MDSEFGIPARGITQEEQRASLANHIAQLSSDHNIIVIITNRSQANQEFSMYTDRQPIWEILGALRLAVLNTEIEAANMGVRGPGPGFIDATDMKTS
jgi:hypothetical protein